MIFVQNQTEWLVTVTPVMSHTFPEPIATSIESAIITHYPPPKCQPI